MPGIKGVVLLALMLLAAASMLAGCNNSPILDQQELELGVRETSVLTVKNADPAELTWSSSDISVAEVNQQGQVKALRPGSAVITVKSGKKTASIKVTVTLLLWLSADSIWAGQGESRQINLYPSTIADGEAVVWTSQDASIAKVDQTGTITGLAPGTTEVTAAVYGETTACTVTVFALAPESLVLAVGKTAQIQVNSGSKAVIWSSGDSGIVKVDTSGNITGLAPGIVDVTASIAGGTARTQVTILGTAPASLTLKPGESRQVQIEPRQGQGAVWRSENTNIAKVDSAGKVTAAAPGMTHIIAEISGQEVVCPVNVPMDISGIKTGEVSKYVWDWDCFSPDGAKFISYSGPLGGETNHAYLRDWDGRRIPLPSPCEYSWYGKVSWRGTNFVYSAAPHEEEKDPAIYLYDTHSDTSTNIGKDFDWSRYESRYGDFSPVFTDDDNIALLVPDGLWNYDLTRQSWSHVLNIQREPYLGWLLQTSWSPDFNKAAWHERDEGGARIIILDIASGKQKSFNTLQHVNDLTWSPDSGKLAWRETNAGGVDEKLVILNLTSWNIEEQDIILSGFAWSKDSSLLAAVGCDFDPELNRISYPLSIFSAAGMRCFADFGMAWTGGPTETEVSWVPGQNQVAYTTKDGLVIRDVTDGRAWLINIPLPASVSKEAEQPEYEGEVFHFDHAWTDDGNLAIAANLGHFTALELYTIDWENWPGN